MIFVDFFQVEQFNGAYVWRLFIRDLCMKIASLTGPDHFLSGIGLYSKNVNFLAIG